MDILKKAVCFLTTEKLYCAKNESGSKKELILSPEFFWYFQKQLPVSGKKRAARIVPRMLAKSLPQKEFTYVLFQKEKNTFDIYALDGELFEQTLKRLKIDKDSITHIGFANTELPEGSYSLKSSVLVIAQGRAALVPKVAVAHEKTESPVAALENIDKLKNKHPVSGGGTIENSVEFVQAKAIALSAVFLLLAAGNGVRAYKDYVHLRQYEQSSSELMSSQSYAQHRVQLRYVKDELEQLHQSQQERKKELADILSRDFNKDAYLKRLGYQNGRWELDIAARDRDRADALAGDFEFLNRQDNIYRYEKS